MLLPTWKILPSVDFFQTHLADPANFAETSCQKNLIILIGCKKQMRFFILESFLHIL